MAIQNRYEFIYYVACSNCNPNGDPDMGNMPRIDPQTMQGFITDGATKRRIRNYVELAYRDKPGMGIIIQQATNINRHIAEAKKAIKKAFQNQLEGRGYSIVEVLSTCPTNWGLSPAESMQFVKDKMIPYYPLGVYKDVTAEEAAK